MAATEAGHMASRAVDDLYREHGREVYRYAYAVLGNHADAEDVTQTTFLNAYRALGQGVRPRKPSNWLLAIASNAIKQKFRQEQARPREVELDERIAGSESDEDGPSIGEILTALSKIPPKQRQAIVLREFEGRTYAEMAEILGVTTSALETLLFRARRSLAEELEHQLTCPEAQLAVSKAVDDRLGRKERRRLRAHLAECPDCAHFARLQPRHRSALRGLMLVPVPLTFPVLEGLAGPDTAMAATTSVIAGEGASVTAASGSIGSAVGVSGATGAGAVVGGVALKAAAVVAAVTIAGGMAVEGAQWLGARADSTPLAVAGQEPGATSGARTPEVTTASAGGPQPGAASSVAPTRVGAVLPNVDTDTHVAATEFPTDVGTSRGDAADQAQPDAQGGGGSGVPQPDQPTGDEPGTDVPGTGQPQGEAPPPGPTQGDAPPAEAPQDHVPPSDVPQAEVSGGTEASSPAQPEPQPQATSMTKKKPAKPAKPKQSKPTKPRPAGANPNGQQPPGHDQPKPGNDPKADEPKPQTPPQAQGPKPEKEPKAEEPKPEKEAKPSEASPQSSPPSPPPHANDNAGGQKKP